VGTARFFDSLTMERLGGPFLLRTPEPIEFSACAQRGNFSSVASWAVRSAMIVAGVPGSHSPALPVSLDAPTSEAPLLAFFITLATCVAFQAPKPRAVGIRRQVSSRAMAFKLLIPDALISAITGARPSACRLARRMLASIPRWLPRVRLALFASPLFLLTDAVILLTMQ